MDPKVLGRVVAYLLFQETIDPGGVPLGRLARKIHDGRQDDQSIAAGIREPDRKERSL